MKTLFSLLLFAASGAAAMTTTWTGTNNWTVTNNWSAGMPGAADDAVIAAGAVTLTRSTQVLTLNLSTNSSKLVFSNWNTTLTASNILLSSSGAMVTHATNSITNPPWTPIAGIFLVCTSLTVQAGASINADYAGYP